MSSQAFAADVMVVGAGPTGLALAAELRRLGVSIHIVDAQAEGANTSRAAVVHARTLEVLEPLGVTAHLLQDGLKVPTFRIRDRDNVLLSIDFSTIPSAYPFALMCPQDRTEAILLASLEKLGGKVDRPCDFLGFETEGSQVVATVRSDGIRRGIRSRWLVGCDGMHSRVRDVAQIAFEGAVYEQSFVLADVRMDWPGSREEVSLFLAPEGLLVVAPLPGDRFRIVATMDDAPVSPSLGDVNALLATRGPIAVRANVQDVLWSSRFRVHHRIATSPRKGRVLVCGDAAHVHSPAGGQGMNTGIQDAVSLAQALAETLRDGNETRIDDWATERHEVAARVVTLTDRLTRMGTARSPTAQKLRNAAIHFAGSLPMVRAALARNIAELPPR
ncbi:MAG: monooxygenase FAD-binding protein [Hyphomicrobiales bacterium]|nr:monooxygenase FAD-binding protein [Hyphomicrobiales bacterium]